MVKSVKVVAEMDMGDGGIKEVVVADWKSDEAQKQEIELHWNRSVLPIADPDNPNENKGWMDRGQTINIKLKYPERVMP